MTPAERAERLLQRLPSVLQAGQNIRRIFEAMGNELVHMERATRQLLKSRWYTLARGFAVEAPLAEKATSELGAIGALFSLFPSSGESDEYFRRHLAELIRIHAQGLTTARSILKLVSLVYLAEQPPTIEVNEGLAIGRFRVRGEDGSLREIRVELIENPLSGASARFFGVPANEQVITYNAGLEQAFPDIDLKASAGDIVVPLLHEEASGFDVIFLGTIKQGQTLALRHGQPALMDGYPLDGVILLANPTRFAGSATADRVFRFNSPEARFSLCELSNRLAPLLPGETRWHYRTMARSELHDYIAHRSDLAGYVERALTVSAAPPVDLTFRWNEVTPAALELRVPIGYVPPHYRAGAGGKNQTDWIGFFRAIQAALEYGRAAGVRAVVGLNLPLEGEVVTMAESPLAQTVNLSFVEEQPSADEITAIGPSIELTETVPEPREFLKIGGVFDVTYFSDSTRFQ